MSASCVPAAHATAGTVPPGQWVPGWQGVHTAGDPLGARPAAHESVHIAWFGIVEVVSGAHVTQVRSAEAEGWPPT
jgi:hypothetical protein